MSDQSYDGPHDDALHEAPVESAPVSDSESETVAFGETATGGADRQLDGTVDVEGAVERIAEDPGAQPSAASGGRQAPDPAPETGDAMIDAALQDLGAADPDDLDAMVAAGESTHRVLQARLSDLGE